MSELDWTDKDLAKLERSKTVRTWTKVGQEIVGRELEGWEECGVTMTQERVARAIEDIEWREIPKGGTLEAPAMPGMGIQETIKQLRIPKVSHIAWLNQLAPYGLYGVRGHYKNGDAEVYVVDLGTHIVPVCTDFHEHEIFDTVPKEAQA